MKWLEQIRRKKVYITERLKLNEKFPKMPKDYWVDYVPIDWLPFDTVSGIQRAQSRVESNTGDMAIMREVLADILAPIVIGWNLDDEQGTVLPIPAVSRDRLGEIPLALIEHIISVATDGAKSDIPFPKESESPPPSSLPEPKETSPSG
jgi:hypothetical protein